MNHYLSVIGWTQKLFSSVKMNERVSEANEWIFEPYKELLHICL